MNARLLGLLVPLCLGLGFIAGRRSVTVGQASAPLLEASRAHRAGALTCVNVPEASASEDSRVLLAACQAQLARVAGPKATFAEPWPEATGAESPEAWTTAMQAVIAECVPGLTMEGIDCEEYPCTALLRGDAGGLDDSGLNERLSACPAWQQWTAGMKKPSAIFEPMDLRCPDGSYQSAWVFLATDNDGDAMDEVSGDQGFVGAIMMLGRRTNAVARLWRCD